MEALVILLAEFLTAFIILAIVLIAEIAVVLLTLLFHFLVWLISGRRGAASPSQAPSDPAKLGWRERLQSWGGISRPVRNVALIGFALTVGGLVLVNTFFFEATVRQAIAMVGKRTGTELEFKSVSGSFFTGRFAFEDIRARRVSETKSSFDLQARSLNADMELLTLIDRPIAFKSLSIDTVSGTFRQPERRKKGARGKGGNSAELIRAKRKFRIENLTLSNVEIALSRGDGAPVAISLKSVASAPFRSNFAVFDTLFRSNVTGQIDGHDITIATQETDRGRVTQWRMPDLPAASVSRFVTAPPIGWLREGTLNVSVDDRWAMGAAADIEMDWNIRMQGVRAEPREAAGLMERAVALPTIAYIKSRDGNVDLRFKLVMNESQFENMSSLDAGALWDTLKRSIAKSIAGGTGGESKGVQRGIDTVVEGFRGFLDKRRKPDATK